MPRAIYPSDITPEQFEIIRPHLESFKKTTKPRELDLYDIFCAILYVLKSSCQWRMLPSDYPKWGNGLLLQRFQITLVTKYFIFNYKIVV
jgi:transposase